MQCLYQGAVILISKKPDMVKRKKNRRKLEKPVFAGENFFPLLLKMGFSEQRAKLAQLWRNWAEVVGEELAEVAVPIRAKDRALILGAENSMLLMELHYVTGEIKEKINCFLASDYFENVFVELNPEGKNCLLPAENSVSPSHESEVRSFRPTVSGKYLAKMDPSSPVAQCYARFAGLKL